MVEFGHLEPIMDDKDWEDVKTEGWERDEAWVEEQM